MHANEQAGAGRLAGKVALIFGAGCVGSGWGNGRAIAVRFAQEGATVVAVDSRPESLPETLELAGDSRSRIETHICDVGDAADLLDRFLHHGARAFHVGEPRREDAPERTLLGGAREQVLRRAGVPVLDQHVIHHPGRRHDALAQRPQALEDQRERDDGSEDERPDRPACGLDDRPHELMHSSERNGEM